MGYYTYFTLTHLSGPKEDYDKLLKDIEEEAGLDLTYGEEAKWYDCTEDCAKISKRYPNVLFQLDGRGEEAGDVWSERFLNGEWERVEVEMPPFQKLLTEQEKQKSKKK